MSEQEVEVIREVNEAIATGDVRGDLRAKHRTSDAEVAAYYEQHLEVRDLLLVKGDMKTGETAFA
jgi:hypothetical protein